MRAIRILLIVVCGMVGFLGLAGGYAAIANPDGPFGISLDVLKHGPFKSFLIPGLTLFIVIGCGQLATGFALIKKVKYYQYAVGAMGAISIGWIVVQCIMMETINAMHIAIFIVGSLQGLYSLYLLNAENLFPVNIIKRSIG